MASVSPSQTNGQGQTADIADAPDVHDIGSDISDILTEAIDLITRDCGRSYATGAAATMSEHAAGAYHEQGDLPNAIRFYRQAAKYYAAMGEATHGAKDPEGKDILLPYSSDLERVREILKCI